MGLLADENFNRDIVRGLLLRMPTLDVVRVKDVGLIGVDDAGVLAWASENDRIILTHDRATMPDFAYGRLREGRAMPGMFVLNDRLPVRRAMEEILLMVECSGRGEWRAGGVFAVVGEGNE